MNLEKVLDFYLANLIDLEAIVKNFNESVEFYEILKEKLTILRKRVEDFEELNLKNEDLNKLLELTPNFNSFKNNAKEIKKLLKRIIANYKKEIDFLLDSLRIIRKSKFRKIVFHKRALQKAKSEDLIFLLRDLIFDDLKLATKKLNEYFLEKREKNLVVILRKDSLFIDYLIIEDILDLNNLKDFKTYEFYKKGLIVPKEEENKELEELVIEGKAKLINYFPFDTSEYLLDKFFNYKIKKEII